MTPLPLVEGCTLTPAGARAQANRVRMLGGSVDRVERMPGVALVHFDSGVDATLVARLIEVERACCSFLDFDFDPAGRTLRVAIGEPGRERDLTALACSFEEEPT